MGDVHRVVSRIASKQAFAFVADAARYDAPTPTSRSMDFTIENATFRIQKAVKATQQYNDRMSGRIDALERATQTSTTKVQQSEFSTACSDLQANLDRVLAGLQNIRI